jgi:HSP20 family molecular chaperone IbpA
MVYESPFRNVFGGLDTLGGVHPPVDVREEGDKFIVDADLPGVKRDNIELRIGDDGRSITIEGKFVQETSERAASEESQGELTKESRIGVG